MAKPPVLLRLPPWQKDGFLSLHIFLRSGTGGQANRRRTAFRADPFPASLTLARGGHGPLVDWVWRSGPKRVAPPRTGELNSRRCVPGGAEQGLLRQPHRIDRAARRAAKPPGGLKIGYQNLAVEAKRPAFKGGPNLNQSRTDAMVRASITKKSRGKKGGSTEPSSSAAALAGLVLNDRYHPSTLLMNIEEGHPTADGRASPRIL